MQNFRNKKRLTVFVIAFMLTFIVGAAFAATPGALQIAGGIGVGDPQLHVHWTEANPVPNLAVATTSNARIVSFMSVVGQPVAGDFLAEQRIEWAIGFVGAGTVELVGRASNAGALPAMLAAPTTTSWEDPDPDFFNMFTVTTHNPENHSSATPPPMTWPIRLEPGETVDVRVSVNWNGDEPPGGFASLVAPLNNWVLDNWLFDPNTGQLVDYTWANNFTISLIYTVAP